MVRISIGIATKKSILVSAAASAMFVRVTLIFGAWRTQGAGVFRYKCNTTWSAFCFLNFLHSLLRAERQLKSLVLIWFWYRILWISLLIYGRFHIIFTTDSFSSCNFAIHEFNFYSLWVRLSRQALFTYNLFHNPSVVHIYK